MAKDKKPTRDELMAAARTARNEDRMVRVKGLTRVRNDGVYHEVGETFEMEWSLVADHVLAGQVAMG